MALSSLKAGQTQMKYFLHATLLMVVGSLHAQSVPSADPAQRVVQCEQLLDQHALQPALSILQDALQRFPDNADLEIELARIYAYQKQDKLAIQAVQSVLQKEPNNRE